LDLHSFRFSSCSTRSRSTTISCWQLIQDRQCDRHVLIFPGFFAGGNERLRLPLIVLSQGSKDSKMSDERFQQWESLQLDLTKLSSNSQRIIAENSGHLVQLDRPELVIIAVQRLIESV
jgi:pimeloyl-ACP methyl ester carboxylesterase